MKPTRKKFFLMNRSEFQYGFGKNQSLHFKIALCFVALHRCCVFFTKMVAKTFHQQKDHYSLPCDTWFIAVVWNQTCSIFEVCRYVYSLPAMKFSSLGKRLKTFWGKEFWNVVVESEPIKLAKGGLPAVFHTMHISSPGCTPLIFLDFPFGSFSCIWDACIVTDKMHTWRRLFSCAWFTTQIFHIFINFMAK